MVPELLRNEFHNSSAVIESGRPQTEYSVSENLYQQQQSLLKKRKKTKEAEQLVAVYNWCIILVQCPLTRNSKCPHCRSNTPDPGQHNMTIVVPNILGSLKKINDDASSRCFCFQGGSTTSFASHLSVLIHTSITSLCLFIFFLSRVQLLG